MFAIAVLAGATVPVVRAEDKIQLRDLPLAVRTAMQRETRGATVKGYARERENGETLYEVETIVGGHSRDLLFDANGALVEVEESITIDAAPNAVRRALEGRGAIVSIESVTHSGRVTYEAIVRFKNGKKSGVAVDADGKPVR